MVKINVSLPDSVLKELDRAAKASRTSRSAFLVEAVKRYLEEKEKQWEMNRRRKAANSINRFREEFGGWDGTAEIIKWRDMH